MAETTDTEFFYALTPEKILESVETLGFRCTGRCLALNSMENRVYEVEIEVDDPASLTSRHDAFRVVKFYRPGRWTREQIMEEHEFLADAVAAELPVVAPLTFDDGSTLKQVPDSGILFAVFQKIGGRVLDEFTKDHLSRLGRLIGRLHGIGSSKQFRHRMKLSPTTYGRENLQFLVGHERLLPAFRPRFEQLVNRICDVTEPWFNAAATQRIHGDCHVGNILWNDSGCLLVDFDDAVIGPCVQDVWLLVPGRDEDAQQKRETFLTAYESMRKFDRTSLRLIEPLRALRMVHFSAWIAKRWQDPSFQRVFVDFGSERYWNEQVGALMEIVEILENGGVNNGGVNGGGRFA